jgi:hypothetical protein
MTLRKSTLWHTGVILVLLVTKYMFAASTAAIQLKETCVRQMSEGLQYVRDVAGKQYLLSLASQKQHKQRGKAKQQQHQERLEQALAEYKQLKESGCDPDDPGNVPTWSILAKLPKLHFLSRS